MSKASKKSSKQLSKNMKLHFNGYLLYSLSIYHFTLSSADTLLLFLDYKPKSGDSLDTSTDNFTTFTGNHSTVRNSLKKFSSSLFQPNFLFKSCTVTLKKLLVNFCNFVKYMYFGLKIKVLNYQTMQTGYGKNFCVKELLSMLFSKVEII